MIRKLLYSFAFAALLFSCNNMAKKDPVTDTDVATTFIRAVLDDDFTAAEKYLLKDETNQQYFESFKRSYQAKNKTELEQYKASDIIVNTLTPLNDTTIINYSNSYEKNVKTNLKLVRTNGHWLIDLKYTFAEKQ